MSTYLCRMKHSLVMEGGGEDCVLKIHTAENESNTGKSWFSQDTKDTGIYGRETDYIRK